MGHRPNNSGISRPLPRSEYHERAAIGCMLEGYDDRSLAVEWFSHPGRQVLFMGLRALQHTNSLLMPRNVRDFARISHGNAVRLCKTVIRSKLWDVAVPLPHEVEQCMAACTQGVLLEWHARKLGELHVRRLAVLTGETLAALATRPAADLAEMVLWLKGAQREAERLMSLERRIHNPSKKFDRPVMRERSHVRGGR